MKTLRGRIGSVFTATSLLTTLPLLALAQPGWVRTTDYPLSGYQYDPVEAGGHIYIAGGLAGGLGGNSFGNVFFSPVRADGSLGSWAATTALPQADPGPGVAAYNDWIYVALGSGGVFRAPVLAGGGVGSWIAETSVDAAVSYSTALRAHNGYLYLFGRYDGTTYFNVVRIAGINSDGSLRPWVSGSLPFAFAFPSVQFYNDRVYLAGGNSSVLGVLGFSYSAPVRTNGALGAWRQEADLPVPLWHHASVITNDQIFLLGGLTNSPAGGQANTIYQGGINATNGSISSWIAVDTLPSAYNTAPGAVYVPAIQYLYLVGGLDAAANASTAQVWRKALGPVVATNHPPLAQIVISPLAELPGVSGLVVLATGGGNATVVLDGSQSSDADNDPLQYLWQEGASIIATGAVATVTLAPGSHTLSLVVNDGKDSGTATITVSVVTPAQTAGLVQALVAGSALHSKQPLFASLAAATASLDRGDIVPGVNQLQAFQKKVRAQVARVDPALAQELIDAVELIIGAVSDN